MATDATLTKIEMNRILKVVAEHGPPASEFLWSERRQEEWVDVASCSYRVSILTHRPTGFYLILGAHGITMSPGLNKKVVGYRHDDSFEKKEDLCAKWLILVKEEAEAPDLWASIIDEKSLSK